MFLFDNMGDKALKVIFESPFMNQKNCFIVFLSKIFFKKKEREFGIMFLISPEFIYVEVGGIKEGGCRTINCTQSNDVRHNLI